ncbi:TPA: type II toxin-antitoxin system HicB family antitoxin [Kluyvera georgiana]
MRYPVTLTPDSGGYVVSFPHVPEALTQGDSREEALEQALDALVTSLEFYFEDNESIPVPGDDEVSVDYVELPASVAAKVLLLNAFVEARISQVDLAKRMGVKKQEVTRLFDLRHSTKIDTIQGALQALGKRLVLAAN